MEGTEETVETKESFEDLNKKLNQLFDEKKNKITELTSLIENFRKYKNERNELNVKVKESKSKRDTIKDEISQVLQQFRTAKEKAGDFSNPGIIRSKIEKIEWKIQTEIMPFKKEQELTKQRLQLEEELKKSLDALKEKKELDKLRTDLTLKIAEERKFHEEVLKYAKDSSEKHTLSVEALNKIKEIRKRLKEIYPEISSVKERFNLLKKERFKARQQEEVGVKDFKKKEEATLRQKISDKFMELKEKFAKKKKLTTEDLLLIQGSKEDII